MKTITTLAVVLFAASTAFAPSASAQHRGDHDGRDRQERRDDRHDRRNDRREVRHERREDRREARHDRREDRRDAIVRHRDDNRRHDRYVRYEPPRRYYAPRTYRPAYAYVAPRGYRVTRWNVGHRMPPAFYARPYYVDPMAYQLRMPPRGYHWVRVDRDVYLVSIASGLIADVLYGIFR